ncbi:MAG: ribosome biogenesis GTPase Der [Candidatus Muiribacteriota bacterium]|jgi:GTP-binding protein
MEKVLIFGRPNVGKSTLFNRLFGQNRAIVESQPGVTRDLNYSTVEWCGTVFTLIDSGGMDFYEKDCFSESILKINTEILKEVNLVLFVVDYESGVTPYDVELATYLRKNDSKVVVVVNKNDNMYDTSEFYSLGFDKMISVSAIHSKNTGDLLDIIKNNIESASIVEENNKKIMIVGKPNVGKSTLFNKLYGKERVMVTDVPGTTRDFIEEEMIIDGEKYTFVDTAGLRRKRSVSDKIEKHSNYRTVKAIEKADVCLLLIDGTEDISQQETKIAGLIKDSGKAVIIVINKWDIVENRESHLKDLSAKIKSKLYFIDYAPVISISAQSGLRVNKIGQLLREVYENYTRTIPDNILNDNIVPLIKLKFPEIKFIKQVKSGPPVFLVFSSKELHFSIKRHIENILRENIELTGTPVKLVVRDSNKK